MNEKFLQELTETHTQEQELAVFKKFFPKGVTGEEFYPGISLAVAFANKILNSLIADGLMEFDDENMVEYEINYIK